MPEFTPTQVKLLHVLSDGMPHTKDSLMECLDDPSLYNLRNHIAILRKKLRPIGQDIQCEMVSRSTSYRHVRLLASPYL